MKDIIIIVCIKHTLLSLKMQDVLQKSHIDQVNYTEDYIFYAKIFRNLELLKYSFGVKNHRMNFTARPQFKPRFVL